MKTSELKIKKLELEEEITKKLREFEAGSGLTITSVDAAFIDPIGIPNEAKFQHFRFNLKL